MKDACEEGEQLSNVAACRPNRHNRALRGTWAITTRTARFIEASGSVSARLRPSHEPWARSHTATTAFGQSGRAVEKAAP